MFKLEYTHMISFVQKFLQVLWKYHWTLHNQQKQYNFILLIITVILCKNMPPSCGAKVNSGTIFMLWHPLRLMLSLYGKTASAHIHRHTFPMNILKIVAE